MTAAEARLSGKEYVAQELGYLFEDQKRSVALLNEIERNTLLMSAALYSFLFTREGLPTGPYVAIALLPFLVTLLSCTRFLGIRERMRRVDERIRAIEGAAGVEGWWTHPFARIAPADAACGFCALFSRVWRALRPGGDGAEGGAVGQSALVTSRDVYWALSIAGTLVFSLLAILFGPAAPAPATPA